MMAYLEVVVDDDEDDKNMKPTILLAFTMYPTPTLWSCNWIW
jgi:hypothetical protein